MRLVVVVAIAVLLVGGIVGMFGSPLPSAAVRASAPVPQAVDALAVASPTRTGSYAPLRLQIWVAASAAFVTGLAMARLAWRVLVGAVAGPSLLSCPLRI